MKQFFLFYLFVIYTSICFAQKTVIDSNVYDKWPSVGGAAISNDGKYVLYAIENQPVGSQTLVLQATKGSWKMEIPGGSNALNTIITQDSKKAVFTKPEDSLGIVTLGNSSVEYIPHVTSFKFPKNGRGGWLAYQLSTPEKELVLRDVTTGKQKSFADVTDYLFSDDGKALVLKIELKKDNVVTLFLNWINLTDGNMTTIWRGVQVDNIVFDASGTQLAFTSEDKINNQTGTSFWYYKAGTDKATILADNQSTGIDNELQLENIQSFSKDGGRLFINLKEKDGPKPKPDAVQVDVWSYADEKLQFQQLKEVDRPYSYTAVIHIQDHRIIRIEQRGNERSGENNGDFVLLFRKGRNVDPSEGYRHSIYLVSTKDGARKRIKEDASLFYSLSPEKKYIIFYDYKQKNFFSYEIVSGVTRNITQKIPATWTGYELKDKPSSSYFPRAGGIAGWMEEDAAVLLYDQNDIWKVDPTGKELSVNLTNGYGRRHNIVFDLGIEDYSRKAFTNKEKIILSAFNRNTKDNGFYSKVLNKKGDPELLTMGPHIYYIPHHSTELNGSTPIKAMNAETYIVKRMSATESPNYFCTNDFKTFTPLSDLHPETNYNWLTTELVTWRTLDGDTSQGILYKPENFDPRKKYPLIFHYYEILSDGLNGYLAPQVSRGGLNIAWFVSNGYLVFAPDIHFKIGETGESVVNTVVSAANHLSQMPWVNAKKMGIQGMSLGGYETNYLVTHTRLFAAACSASGISNFVSGYGSLDEDGNSLQGMYELTFWRMGNTLWERPDLYIKNSPIFQADKVTTPFLMMHTKNDGVCSFANAIEFFTALRRLGKKVWMLQYDDGNHGIWGKSAADFSIRLAQFFDHYLKGVPAPKWMIEGVPAKMKGIETGLELDGNGREP